MSQEVHNTNRQLLSELAISAFLGFVFLIVVLGIAHQHKVTKDLTKEGINSLVTQSLDAVHDLDRKVELLVFVKPGFQAESVRDLLDKYKAENPEYFSYTLVDPEADPLKAKEYQITAEMQGVLLALDDSGREERVSGINEDEVTNALIRLRRNQVLTLYSIEGHGELQLEDSEAEGLSSFRNALRQEGFVAYPLQLFTETQVPEECSVLLIAGPTQPLQADEEAKVTDYLKSGGNLVIMLDEQTPAYYSNLIDSFGLRAPPKVIVDMSLGQEQYFRTLAVQAAPDHPIVDRFRNAAQFFFGRPVEGFDNEKTGWKGRSILFTGNQNIYTVDPSQLNSEQQIAPEKAEAQSLVAVSEFQLPEAQEQEEQEESWSRIVALGDAQFVNNRMLNAGGNRDLIMNSLQWLCQRESFITVREPLEDAQPVMLSSRDASVYKFLFWFFSPLLLAGLGYITYRNRQLRA